MQSVPCPTSSLVQKVRLSTSRYSRFTCSREAMHDHMLHGSAHLQQALLLQQQQRPAPCCRQPAHLLERAQAGDEVGALPDGCQVLHRGLGGEEDMRRLQGRGAGSSSSSLPSSQVLQASPQRPRNSPCPPQLQPPRPTLYCGMAVSEKSRTSWRTLSSVGAMKYTPTSCGSGSRRLPMSSTTAGGEGREE